MSQEARGIGEIERAAARDADILGTDRRAARNRRAEFQGRCARDRVRSRSGHRRLYINRVSVGDGESPAVGEPPKPWICSVPPLEAAVSVPLLVEELL